MTMRICFVCSGNICRSPMAEVITRAMLDDAGLSDVLVSSAGTGEWHEGEGANPPAVRALADAGYDGSTHRAQGFDRTWFDRLDLVVALDRGHERALRSWARTDAERARVVLLRSFDPVADGDEVADPYGHGPEVFAACLDEVEAACRGLVDRLVEGGSLTQAG
ncbi:low molecular weight protein-tyrosine-phosphatase [Angustibacter sp. McL0619]|uniref:low molecular weight protein-tyrosine-phosphatase n=1 Tax=Angustibacter sp. McL0619 TaxID=3415676 RepID=UPI003CF28ED5